MRDRSFLLQRIQIGNLLLALLDKDPDPRAPKVAAILTDQRAKLIAELEALEAAGAVDNPAGGPERGKGQPPGVVVGLKTLTIRAKRH